MGRNRLALALAAGCFLVGATARAQFYPFFPDTAHSSVPPPYIGQGPLPIQQQSRPLVEVAIPLEANRGVPNGLAAAPPRMLRALARRNLRLPSGLTEDSFQASETFLPAGTRWAVSRFLPAPGRGVEYYLLMPPGAVLPPHVFDCGRVVTVVDGEASIAVGAAPMQRMQASSPVTVPAGAPHELVCGNDQSCLVLVRADGPLHVTWLDSRDVENPHNMRAARDTH